MQYADEYVMRLKESSISVTSALSSLLIAIIHRQLGWVMWVLGISFTISTWSLLFIKQNAVTIMHRLQQWFWGRRSGGARHLRQNILAPQLAQQMTAACQ